MRACTEKAGSNIKICQNRSFGDNHFIIGILNGNSKMYRYEELKKAIEIAGFELKEAHHSVGPNAYSLLRFRKK